MFHRNRYLHLLCILGLVLFAAACATSAPKKSSVASMARRDWRPSRAGLGDWVWIRLDTDEWLKGEIIVLRKESLQFESDNLGKLTIDWDDVVEVYSKRENSFLFGKDEQVRGAVSISKDVVTVTEANGKQHVHPRKELRSIVPGGQSEADLWSGTASIGAGFRSGNTDQVDVSFDCDIARRTLDSRYTLTYVGNYSEANNDVLVNSHRLNTTFDLYLNWKLYLTLASLEIYRDPIVNIDWQVTPGVGAGYTIIDDPGLLWEVSAGVGYQYTDYVSVEAGADDTDAQTSFLAGTDLEYEITNEIDFELDYSLTVGLSDSESRKHHLRARFAFEITDELDFEVTFTWDRNDPTVADEDGVKPEPYDVYVTIGLGLEF